MRVLLVMFWLTEVQAMVNCTPSGITSQAGLKRSYSVVAMSLLVFHDEDENGGRRCDERLSNPSFFWILISLWD